MQQRKLQQQRDVARAAQDWAKADALRDQIQKLGVKVQDSKVGDGGGSKIVLTKKAVLEGKAAKKERQATAAGKPLKAAKSAAKAVHFSTAMAISKYNKANANEKKCKSAKF